MEGRALHRRHFAALVSYERDGQSVEETFQTLLVEERAAALQVSYAAAKYRLTRCTGARHRGSFICLAQDENSGAAADILTVSTTCVGVKDWRSTLLSLSSSSSSSSPNATTSRSDPITDTSTSTSQNAASLGLRVLAVKELLPDARSGRVLHADSDCRQRSYECVVPLSWLKGAEGWQREEEEEGPGKLTFSRDGERRSGTAIDAFYGSAADEVRDLTPCGSSC